MPGFETGEQHSLRGPIDRPALLTIRDVFKREEPLATPTLDEFLNPSILHVQYDDGLGAVEQSRLDIRWTVQHDYNYHYTDTAGVNVRWDRHPHGGTFTDVPGLDHFHPSPDASSNPDEVEASCITLQTATLVTRAVIKLWRAAYHADSLDPLNSAQNPP